MPLSVMSNNNYDVICLQGAYNLSTLPTLTPQLTVFFQEHSPKDLVIDLTNVTTIDSSIIRVLLNLKKRIEFTNNRFFIMHPSEDVLTLFNDSNLVKILTIINDYSELQRIIEKFSYDRYFPFTYQEKGLKRIRCSCGACGSNNVTGYLLSPNDYIWKWGEKDIFPSSEDSSGNFFDYYSVLPIVCTDCLMSSIDISLFNVIDDNNTIRYKSILDDKTKILLSKSTKKRRKMMETGGVLTESYFSFPRNRITSFQAYILAESCSKAVAVNKGGTDPFNIGYMNFLALQFAPDDQKEELTNNCRTWLTQVVADPAPFTTIQMAQTYYILLNVSLTVERYKDVSKFFTDFVSLIDTLPEQETEANEIINPLFWFRNAEHIWQKEIERQSSALKL
jgi:anti-anti-sigma factor